MNPHFHIVPISLLVLTALLYIFVAAKTLRGKRPLVFSSRWHYGIRSLVLVSISSPFANDSSAFFTVFLAVCFGIAWIRLKSYDVFGASETYFRQALLASAASQGYTVKRVLSGYQIVETGQKVQVEIRKWLGPSQLVPLNRGSTELVAQLAKGMREYFKANPGEMNDAVSYAFFSLGVLMMGMSTWLLLWLKLI